MKARRLPLPLIVFLLLGFVSAIPVLAALASRQPSAAQNIPSSVLSSATPTATATPVTPTLLSITVKSVAASDGWVLEKSENANIGGSMDAASTTLLLGDDAQNRQYRSILSFDTSSIPDTAIVSSVTLKTEQQSSTGGATLNMFNGLMVDVATGSFGTPSLQLTDFQAAANKTDIGPFTSAPVSSGYTFDLTGAQAYINKTGLTQLRLRFSLDDNNNSVANTISLYSGNSSANAPALTVNYYLPPFTMNQTLSDGAQQTTIAFDGLSFVTGDLGADSFFPPGKVADFWGFQYLRDNDLSGMGHNTDFLTKASYNMLTVLSSTQRAQLVALAKSQVSSINEYGYNRFVLMEAFRRLLAGDLPAGTSGLNEDAVKTYSAKLYHLDGQISYQRAQVMGSILRNLTTIQKAYLDKMVGQGMTSWPNVGEPAGLSGLSPDEKVAVMTYAGDMFSWYAGSITADVYFCPERQGTYFGSFYMKDAPAIGNPGYSIGTNITADYGNAFLAALNTQQSNAITGLVTSQKTSLYAIVNERRAIATQLRQFISGGTPGQATVLALMDRYGELDGEIVYQFATAFSQVDSTLTTDQLSQLKTLRTKLLGDLAYPTGAYLYSQPVSMPEIPNTDFLFK